MTYDALIERLQRDDDPQLEVSRTRAGVVLQQGGIRLELVGDQAVFDRYLSALSKDAKAALGRADGLGLFLAHLQESIESSSAVSAVWRFTAGPSGRPKLIKDSADRGAA
jgi:hypothetical protein